MSSTPLERACIVVAPSAIALLSLGEVRVFHRLLFTDPEQYGFVLRNVHGVLTGTPALRSFQHRLLGPWLVRALEAVRPTPVSALELFCDLTLWAANMLLFFVLRRRGASRRIALTMVGAFGFARILTCFRLEYPWDQIDILLFSAFGYWAARGGGVLPLLPLLAIGTLNHETALYMPLWLLLSALRKQEGARVGFATAAVTGASMAASILAVRRALYVGRPLLPDEDPDRAMPVIGNQFHLAHNLHQIFFRDWVTDRVFVAAGLLTVLALLIRELFERTMPVAPAWSLWVIATIFCFGYVNETRHYLPLLAFWFAYAPLPAR